MRQTIFDLTDDYLRLLELAEDPETPEDVLADTLEGHHRERRGLHRFD